jgi:hypothetical protein
LWRACDIEKTNNFRWTKKLSVQSRRMEARSSSALFSIPNFDRLSYFLKNKLLITHNLLFMFYHLVIIKILLITKIK